MGVERISKNEGGGNEGNAFRVCCKAVAELDNGSWLVGVAIGE